MCNYYTFKIKLYSYFRILLVGFSFLIFRIFTIKDRYIISWSLVCFKKLINFSIYILIDWINCVFLGILLIIVASVYIFGIEYMRGDKNIKRLFILLNLFVGSMIVLVLIPDLIFFLVGWDGLGITSFLLVAFYASYSSWTASIKTYLFNRIGDALLILSILLKFQQGRWGFFVNWDIRMVILILIFLASMTKSAQHPFSRWLPAAMAAPTPVSALVHSSTLVTAGVFLILRFSNILPSVCFFLAGVIGMFTMLIARWCAVNEWDIKKVVAYSTLRQLGLLFYSIGCGNILFTYFHLMTHAVFKALLFIRAGFFISRVSHFQDMRQLNSLNNFKPLLNSCCIIRILALAGCPLLAGFFSKEFILESSLFTIKIFMKFLLFISLFFTVIYSLRFLYMVWRTNKNSLVCYQSYSNIFLLSVIKLRLRRIIFGSIFSNFLYISFSKRIISPLFYFMVIMGIIIFWWFNIGKSWVGLQIFDFLVVTNSINNRGFFIFEQNISNYVWNWIFNFLDFIAYWLKIFTNLLRRYKMFTLLLYFIVLFIIMFLN